MSNQPKKDQAREDLSREQQSRRVERKLAEHRSARNRKIMMVVVPVLVVALLAGIAYAVRNGGDDDKYPTIVAPAAMDPAIPFDGRVMGSPDAPVTVVEWGDYQCPGCGQFWLNGKPVIMEYVRAGKVKFEFRDYAFIGPESKDAAEAAYCGEEQGRYWDYHEALYANQQAFYDSGGGENGGQFAAKRLKDIASAIGLDTEAFNECLSSGKTEEAILNMLSEGQGAGVDSTPTVFINGTEFAYRGPDDLRANIEAAIAAAGA